MLPLAIYLRKRAIEATMKMLEAVGKDSMALALHQQVESYPIPIVRHVSEFYLTILTIL